MNTPFWLLRRHKMSVENINYESKRYYDRHIYKIIMFIFKLTVKAIHFYGN